MQSISSGVSQKKQQLATNCTEDKNNENVHSEEVLIALQKQNNQLNAQQQQKRLSKEISKLLRLMKKGHYKQGLDCLLTFQINHQNVMQILQLNVIRHLSNLGNLRSISKIKDKIKKALISKYFRRQAYDPKSAINYQQLSYPSVRGKVMRKLKKLIRTISGPKSDHLVFQWQKRIWQNCKGNHQMYVQLMLKTFKQLQGKNMNAGLQLSINTVSDLNQHHSQ